MKAIEITAPGGPDVLRLADRPEPVAGAGELLIGVAAAGVNRPDVLQRKGRYPVPPGASDIPGLEVAGRVLSGDAAAMQETGIRVGDRVCALVAGGGYAERCVAPVGQCLPVPEGWDDVQAAALPETCFTVWSNVFQRGGLRPGETVLVHGGSSGIGVTAIQLAKAHGARVIVTAGSDAKVAACLALGADHGINHRTHDFAAEVMRLTDGHGVDVVLDMVAGPYVAREMGCMAPDGRIVLIAVQGGKDATLDASVMMQRRLTLTGSTLRARSVEFKSGVARALRSTVWPWLVSGLVKPVIHAVYPAAEAARAHADMEAGDHIGKLVLTW